MLCLDGGWLGWLEGLGILVGFIGADLVCLICLEGLVCTLLLLTDFFLESVNTLKQNPLPAIKPGAPQQIAVAAHPRQAQQIDFATSDLKIGQ